MSIAAGRSRLAAAVRRWAPQRPTSRSNAHHQPVTRALAAAAEIELDGVTFDVRGGDMFLLRIDGLSSEVDEASMAQALLPGSRTSLP